VLFVGLYFSWQQLSDTRKSTQDSLAVTRQGQITDRFTRAVDQLGSQNDDKKPKVETRVGGIYALERIARDSLADTQDPDARKNQKVIMEILTAYVRENARWQGDSRCDTIPIAPASSADASPTVIVATNATQIEQTVTPTASVSSEPRADVVAALTVLARNDWFGDVTPTPTGVGLTTPAPIATPTDIAARAWNVDRTDLRHVVLPGSRLTGLTLYCAHLDWADFSQASLVGASFNNSQLVHTQLFEAHVEGAHFNNANLDHANFGQAYLNGADFNGANLDHANFIGSHLEGAILLNVQGIVPAQFNVSCFDDHTQWPPGFRHPRPIDGCTS
jgi:uncharacterized protein YjbI with pentapeptide repeats